LSTEYKWEVRKRNTARFLIAYEQDDGTPIDLTGATATLFVYSGGDSILLQKSCNLTLPNVIDVFLTKNEILAMPFESGGFEVIVSFANGIDEETFVDGPIIVKSGAGPFE
jgi:hypothetical protein